MTFPLTRTFLYFLYFFINLYSKPETSPSTVLELYSVGVPTVETLAVFVASCLVEPGGRLLSREFLKVNGLKVKSQKHNLSKG